MRTRSFQACLAATALLTAGAGLTACAADPDDVDLVAAALEQDNGGLDMEDEAATFGATDEFAAAEIEASTEFTDAMDADTEVVAMRELPSVLTGRVVLMWGQLPPDRAPEAYARDWSGSISLNRGAIIVRRVIGFEEATDQVMPRTDRASVEFHSITRPFADGLTLELVDPDPGNATPLTLTYAPADGSGPYAMRAADLLAGPAVYDVDSEGNRVIATLLRRDDACDQGFAHGRWRALRDGLGGMLGVVTDDAGVPVGHLRGIWGARRSGEQVFFGKYINRDGQFRGIFGGHYRDGHVVGRWITAAGEHGRLDGRYEESLPGRPAGGNFGLRWAETSCARDIPADN
ncbi:MAG: hypothetical protein H6708_15450 [Kofleriaceae bacterium]|nr:hypothetical protein [Myxococcales bacterium]MCB9561798.1 hypothetical protein [Kofleriaceae bacterium]